MSILGVDVLRGLCSLPSTYLLVLVQAEARGPEKTSLVWLDAHTGFSLQEGPCPRSCHPGEGSHRLCCRHCLAPLGVTGKPWGWVPQQPS